MKQFEVTFRVRGHNHSRQIVVARDDDMAAVLAAEIVSKIFKTFELVGVREIVSSQRDFDAIVKNKDAEIAELKAKIAELKNFVENL